MQRLAQSCSVLVMNVLVQSSSSPYTVPTSELEDETPLYVNATLGRRCVNFVVDSLCIYTVSELVIPAVWLLGVEKQFIPEIDFELLQSSPEFFPFVLLAFYLFFEWRVGRTPGKFLTNTCIVTSDGARPGFWRLVLRSACRLVPFNVISIYLGADRRSWHDLISDTCVVVRV